MPLTDQNRSRWDQLLIGRGLDALARAEALGGDGPYVLQAALAACHARARRAADTDWSRIAALCASRFPGPRNDVAKTGHLRRVNSAPTRALWPRHLGVTSRPSTQPANRAIVRGERRLRLALRGHELERPAEPQLDLAGGRHREGGVGSNEQQGER